MKNCIIASTSTIHGSGYLQYILPQLEKLFQNTDEVLFIPYAQPGGISCDEYTQKAQEAFSKIGKKLVGLHIFSDQKEALTQAQGLFTGGGNTFRLVNALYQNDIM